MLKSRKLAFFLGGWSMVFGQKQENVFLFSFSVKYSKRKCFVSRQIEIQPFKTTIIWIQKSRKLLFFKTGQSMGFGQKQESLLLFSFSVEYSKRKCFVSRQIEIQPFKATRIWIQKSRKLLFFKTGKAMGFGQNCKLCRFLFFS